MAGKMAAASQFASIMVTLSHFNWISSKFYIWLFAYIKTWLKFEYEFCPTNDIQYGRQNGRRYQFVSAHCCGHSDLLIGIFSEFFNFLYMDCLYQTKVCARLFACALWSPAGKGLTSWLSFVVSAVSLSLSHWYPGSGVVLDCIDS